MIRATTADVVACYRLLLGREPDPGGLRNFTNLVRGGGMATTDLAALFIASPEFVGLQQKARQASERLETVRLRDLPLKLLVAPAWNAIHREIAGSGAYEPHVTREMRRLDLRGKVFVDCGANMGYFTVLASHLGAKVWCFEPNQRNVWFILRNLQLNGLAAEVQPYAVADGERMMVYNPVEGNGQLEPFAGQVLAEGQEFIRTVTLDRVLAGVEPAVIKLDIEGAEWLALSGATRTLKSRPMLFMEFSPNTLEAVSRIAPLDFMRHFAGMGYRIEVIEPGGTSSHPPERVVELARRSPGTFADLKLTPR